MKFNSQRTKLITSTVSVHVYSITEIACSDASHIASNGTTNSELTDL